MIVVLGAAFVAFMFVISLLGGAFYSVDQGERAVITRWGEITAVEGPGFHTKTPFVESANVIEIRQLSTSLDKVLAYSKDQQTAELSLVVLWHAPEDRVAEVYSRYGSLDAMASRELTAKLPSAAKVVFGGFNAVNAIQDRARLIADIDSAIRAELEGAPLIVDSVQVANIDFSDAYEAAIEQRMTAEVDVQRKAQAALQAEQDAKKTVTEAKAEADSNLAKMRATAEGNLAIAQAQAAGINALAEAEANRLRQRGAALRDNPALIDLTAAERWDGKLPSSMVPSGALPFVNVTPRD